MSNEIYTDLEKQVLEAKTKYEILDLEVIKLLVKSHPNDADLGRIVREFINKTK